MTGYLIHDDGEETKEICEGAKRGEDNGTKGITKATEVVGRGCKGRRREELLAERRERRRKVSAGLGVCELPVSAARPP